MQLPAELVLSFETPKHMAALIVLVEKILGLKPVLGPLDCSQALDRLKQNKDKEQSVFFRELIDEFFTEENFDLINTIFELTPGILFPYPCSVEVLWQKITRMPNYLLLFPNYIKAYQQLAKNKYFTKPHPTPLHFAAKEATIWIIDLILQLGHSWQVLDHNKKSILDVVLVHKRQSALEYLSATNMLPSLMEITTNVDLPSLTSLLPTHIDPKIIVALDLDGTLASARLPFASWHRNFREAGLFVRTSLGDYIIHPGALELVRMLVSMPNVELTFFSAGHKTRNLELVYGILCLALGTKKADEVFKNCRILSREECLGYMSFLKRQNFNIKDSVTYKNVLALDPNPNWTVIFDDCHGNAFPNQEGNLLFLRWSQEQQLKAFQDIRIQSMYGCPHRDQEFFRANLLYYAAGLFLTALQFAKQRDITLRDALFRLQFKMEGDFYVYDKKVAKQTKYHEKGLEAFRKVHRDACFLTGPWQGTFFNRARKFIRTNQAETSASTLQPG